MDISTLDPFVACCFIYSMATTIALGMAFKRMQWQDEKIKEIAKECSTNCMAVMTPVVLEIKKLKSTVGVQ